MGELQLTLGKKIYCNRIFLIFCSALSLFYGWFFPYYSEAGRNRGCLNNDSITDFLYSHIFDIPHNFLRRAGLVVSQTLLWSQRLGWNNSEFLMLIPTIDFFSEWLNMSQEMQPFHMSCNFKLLHNYAVFPNFHWKTVHTYRL